MGEKELSQSGKSELIAMMKRGNSRQKLFVFKVRKDPSEIFKSAKISKKI